MISSAFDSSSPHSFLSRAKDLGRKVRNCTLLPLPNSHITAPSPAIRNPHNKIPQTPQTMILKHQTIGMKWRWAWEGTQVRQDVEIAS
jgi:hypothetical protein